jgi:glucosyl-3-phosphoglycerate synthase
LQVGKMNGRVNRLLVSPLLMAMEHVLGPSDYISFMRSFRYPLAGRIFFSAVTDPGIAYSFGLGPRSRAFCLRCSAIRQVTASAKVDLAETYDHKHQSLSEDDRGAGLSRMSIDISKVLIRKLATKGHCFGSGHIPYHQRRTYFRLALDMVRFYQTDAEINGLSYDIDAEERAVELFAENIMRAGDDYIYTPMETPFIPSWARVTSAIPDIAYRLRQAVEADNLEQQGRIATRRTAA